MEFFEALWNDFNEAFGDTVSLGTNTVTTLNIIVWSLFIGFVLAIIITVFNKIVVGRFVRKLIEKEAFSEESALSLSDIGCKNIYLKFALRKKGTLRHIVYAAKGDIKTSVKTEKAKFYIPEKTQKKAESIYGKKDITAKTVILSVIALLIVSMAALYFIPDLITMLKNFISGLAGESNIL